MRRKKNIKNETSKCNGCVKINWNGGRYGNKLFIYFIARLYAEKNSLNLVDNIDNVFFEIKKPKNFGKNSNNLKKYIIKDKDIINRKTIPYYGPGIYIFDGYFQYEDIFYENKDKILSYINLEYEKNDIFTIHVRLDDYYSTVRHLIISVDYYIDCIKQNADNYEKIYIVCDKLRYTWEKEYMKDLINKIKLLNKIPIYNENSIEKDIKSIIQSNYIVTSNSTFCFWGVFFSDAEKIISFPFTGLDILPNEKINKWKNNPQIFKYDKDKKFIFNMKYSNNIIDYFEKMY